MNTCHYIFFQTHRMYNSKVNSKVIGRLWVMTTCQCRLIINNKCAILVRDLDDQGGSSCVRAGGTWEISHLPIDFVVNLKLL